MAYNYGYPVTYQYPQSYTAAQPGFNQYASPQPTYSQAQPQPQQQGIIWVQGEAAAKAYPVAAGSNVLLMDSEGECFYIKSTDASGMPLPLRVFEYKEVVRTEPQTTGYSADFNPDEYVKREEIEDLKRQIQNMNNRRDRNNGKQSV